MTPKVTDKNLLEIFKKEPALQELEERIVFSRSSGVPAFRLWYGRGGFKQEMSNLVGFNARNPEVSSNSDYELVYGYFIKLLGL